MKWCGTGAGGDFSNSFPGMVPQLDTGGLKSNLTLAFFWFLQTDSVRGRLAFCGNIVQTTQLSRFSCWGKAQPG